jgi:putative DNA primase/helicase
MASAKPGGGAPNGPTKGGAADAAAAPASTEAKSRRPKRAARRQKPEVVHERPNRSREQRIVNSIRPSRPRERSSERNREAPNILRGDQRASQSEPASASERRAQLSERPEADSRAIPDSVRDRFTQDGRRWYFPDGAPAFRDHGRRLSTPSVNAEVIASLVEIAKARGWDSITVRGSERFRQEAWKQAKRAGLQVRGYRASEAERAAAIRALSRLSNEGRPGEPPLEDPLQKEESRAAPQGAQKEASAARRGDPIVGKLLDHGKDHYRFDPKADWSYYIRVQTEEGARTIWSDDFYRAITNSLSEVKIGDSVVLQHRGAIPVVVTRTLFDDDGNVIGEKRVSTHRNSWSVERTDFIARRENAANALRDSTLSPKQIVKKHPELAGALLEVKLAELAARQRPDPRDREAFVARVRNGLADEIARGEPLPTVQMREPPARRSPREREPNTPVR